MFNMTEKKTWQKHNGVVLDSVKGFDVIECEICGFKHIIPIPKQDDLCNYYHTEFVGRRPKLIDRIKEDFDWWKIIYTEKYSLFESFLPRTDRRLLDVGCGLGYFLKEGKNRGWEVTGIEPSEQSIRHASELGIEVLNASIYDEVVKNLPSFNVVHMHEVLEHLSDPVNALKCCHDLLSPGGLLCLIVPNDYNILQNLLRNELGFKPWWVNPPEHINYFNTKSLRGIVENNGFNTLFLTTTFPMEFFLLIGQNYVGNDQLGRQCHGYRKNFEMNLDKGGLKELKEELYMMFAEKGIGREIMLVARKKI